MGLRMLFIDVAPMILSTLVKASPRLIECEPKLCRSCSGSLVFPTALLRVEPSSPKMRGSPCDLDEGICRPR
jgi:hypothetical protein